MKIILSSGQAGAGKDCVSDYLALQLGSKSKGWYRGSFAAPIKKIFMDSFNVDNAFIEKWKRLDEIPPGMLQPVRKALQFIGDGFRKIQEDVWVNIALKFPGNQIISDGRYYSEARAIRHEGGKNIVIWRPGYENNDPNESESQIKTVVDWCLNSGIEDGPIPHNKTFPGFNMVDYYDLFIKNDGTLEQLYNKIDKFIIPHL